MGNKHRNIWIEMDIHIKIFACAIPLASLILFSALSYAETEEELEKRIDNLEGNVRALQEQQQSFRKSIYDQINSNDVLADIKIELGKTELDRDINEKINTLKTDISDKRLYLERYLTNIIYGLIIAFIGFIGGIYFYLKHKITIITEQKTEEYVKIQRSIEQADLYRDDAVSMFGLYNIEKNKKPNIDKAKKDYYLNRAIELAKWATTSANNLPDDKVFIKYFSYKNSELFPYAKIKARVNNNYAVYLTERNHTGDENPAREASLIAYELSKNEIPGHKWHKCRETYAAVLNQWGDDKEKLDAKGIIESLCDNKSIGELSWKIDTYRRYIKMFAELDVKDERVTKAD